LSKTPHQRRSVPHRSRRIFAVASSRQFSHRRLMVSAIAVLVLSAIVAASFARPGSAQVSGVNEQSSSKSAHRGFRRDSQSANDSGMDAATAAPDKVKRHYAESVPGEIIVRFRPEVAVTKGSSQLELAVVGGRAEIPVEFQRFAGPELVRGLRMARVAPEETERAIEALRARPDVLYAEPNYIRYATKTPNDPRYPEMWGLKNTGQSPPGNDIRAEPAWDVTTGSKNVVVGIIDEGIDIDHEDLRDNIWINPGEVPNNGIDDDANGYVDDVHGWDFAHNDNTVFDYTEPSYPQSDNYSGDVDDHGTHVAGTIGAQGNNGKGVVGVNWQVSLMSLKFLTGPEGGGTLADVLKAFAYAKAMRELWNNSGGVRGANIRVLNNSYGGGGFSQAELESVRALGDAGILFVVSAGNEASNNDRFPTYPSSYIATNLISVAASNVGGYLANFSNFGLGTVHMTAPGDHILSTTPRNTYMFASGTSMAAPHVTGSAALLCAAFPALSMQKLRSTLLYSGYVANGQSPSEFPVSTGRSADVNSALLGVNSSDTTSPGPINNITLVDQSFPHYSLRWDAPGDDVSTGKVTAYQVRFSDTDASDSAKFDLATPLPGPVPKDAGQSQFVRVRLPWKHHSGFIAVRAVDEAGNAGPISSTPISVDQGIADPFIVEEGSASPLSTGGTPLGLNADDSTRQVDLPFGFRAFEQEFSFVWVSTNGVLYAGYPEGGPDDQSSPSRLNGKQIIAGAWDDLRTDKRAGDDVYIVRPDPDRIIFRWQAVTYDAPMAPGGVSRGENPVNFEIELQINGTIIYRYGDGNQKLFPVVGLGGGWPEPYLVSSHTSDGEFKDLTNAGTITFTRRNPLPPPSADLGLLIRSGPDPVATGGEETFDISVNNAGPNSAPNTVVTHVLPAGLTFLSCTTTLGSCAAPALGSSGVVTVNVADFPKLAGLNIRIVAKVTAGPGMLNTPASVGSSRFDHRMSNNTAPATVQVVQAPAFGDVSRISSAGSVNLALKQEGTVWAWGQNNSGAMGNGSLYGIQSSPLQVSELLEVTAVSTSGFHGLAVKSDGTVWGWGQNVREEVGGGLSSQVLNPIRVSGLSNIVSVAAGSFYSLALDRDGRVWAWGANSQGQLGLGTSDNSRHDTPVVIPGLSGVTFIAAGSGFNVAVRNDGTVWTWGKNENGQLGAAGPSTDRPAQVPGVSGVRAVAAGPNHVLALTADGTVMGWGLNTFGQAGSTNFVYMNPTPAPVAGLTSVTGIAAGYGFSLAVKSDGTVWEWGLNPEQLGSGVTNGNPQPNPAMVNGITNAVSLAAGSNHGLALLNDGSLRAWGSNYNGEIGDGTTFLRPVPVQVTGVARVGQPLLSPGNDSVGNAPMLVTLATTTTGATIHYTVNGQDPTEADPAVASNSSITIRESLTLKARAFKAGWIPSHVSTATYQVQASWMRMGLTPTHISQVKAWTVGGRTYVYVMARFPDAGFRMSRWAQAYRNGSDIIVDAEAEWYTGVSTQAMQTTAHIYDLGPLAPGNYNFLFMSWSAVVKNLAITVSADPPAPNPIDDQRQFVRQQYLDFLHREPDGPGWDHWTGEITECTTDPSKRLAGESEAECIVRKRANTSAAFFLSPEFRNTGYFVLRVYRGSLGRMPYFGGSVPADNMKDEFTRDHAAVSAGIVVNNQLDQTVMYANKQAFVNQFVTRADFLSIYGGLDNEHYVDKLFQTTAITPTAEERQELINGLSAGNETRASVLFKIVDGRTEDSVPVLQTRYGQLFYNQQLNPGFVQMEYFGYMKRDPDEAGYAFWLAKLNQYGGNFVDAQMVLAFISSPEYRARFGQP